MWHPEPAVGTLGARVMAGATLLLLGCGEGESPDTAATRAGVNGAEDVGEQYQMVVGLGATAAAREIDCKTVSRALRGQIERFTLPG